MEFAVEGATMNWPKFMMMFALSLFFSNRAVGQECPSLNNALPAELLSFLSATEPSQDNAECLTWAIKSLGTQKYEAAIPVLAKFLDFKRPLSDLEKKGFYLHLPSVWEMYPAADALDRFGEKALPTLINVIKGESGSDVARQNAIAVLWKSTNTTGQRALLY